MTRIAILQQQPITLYQYHPVTGADANDFDFSEFDKSDAEDMKIDLAMQFRHGARFYWRVELDGSSVRVERGNYEFVCKMIGQALILNHDLP
jgi:hypothetical protein